MTSRTTTCTTIVAILALGSALGVAAQDAPASVWDGIYTEEQAQRGQPLYDKACAECHGTVLEGGEMAPPLAGSEFVWAWNGLTVGDLFERLRVSMPDANPRSMSNDEKADVLAFMLRKNDFPSGESELAARTQALAPILFEAVRSDAAE